MLDTKQLKPGDTVVVSRHGLGSIGYEQHTVVSVSPSGRVHLSNGKTFNPDGFERGRTRGSFYWSKLEEPSEVSTNYIRRHQLLDRLRERLRRYDETWTTDQLAALDVAVQTIRGDA